MEDRIGSIGSITEVWRQENGGIGKEKKKRRKLKFSQMQVIVSNAKVTMALLRTIQNGVYDSQLGMEGLLVVVSPH